MEPNKKRLLLVDDDPELIWQLGRCLARADYAVTTCADGEEAKVLLDEKRFDIMVSDIQMPGTNGLALLEWVHEHHPHMRVVIVTGFGSPSLRQLALRKGAVLYMDKPVDPDLLIEVLRAPPTEDSFSGTVGEIDLVDYLQLLILSRRQVLLEVACVDGEVARIYIDKGRVPHAEYGSVEGQEAVVRCLNSGGGTFSTLPWREPTHTTIEMRGENLLMEVVRLKDEKTLTEPAAVDDDLAAAIDLSDLEF